MTSSDLVILALQIAVMLGAAIGLGSLMRKIRQPAVVVEMLAGIALGPTVLGVLAAGFFYKLFLSSENAIVAREALVKLGMLFFLFIAGLETDPAKIRTLEKKPLLIGLVGTLLPIMRARGRGRTGSPTAFASPASYSANPHNTHAAQ